MASERTKKCRIGYWIFTIIHILLMFGPLAYYLPAAFAIAEPSLRITMSLAAVIIIILALIMFIVEGKTRGGLAKTIMWVTILMVIFALNEVKIFILIMAITTIIDEVFVTRLREHFKVALNTNKEIDRRI